MDRILDAADRVYWWLKHHLAVAAGLVALVVVGLVVLATRGGGEEAPKVPAGAVAVVGDAPITESDVTRWQAIYAKGTSSSTAKPTAEEARKAAFELLAGSTFILQEAEREEVAVPEADVQKSVDDYFTQSGATTPAARNEVLKQVGVSEDDLRFQQRVALLSAKLRERVSAAVPQPSADAVEAAYEKEPQRWATPSQRDVRAVIARDEATAKQARTALEQGKTFAQVVEQFSIDATLTQNKGVIKDLKPGTNIAVVERPVFAAQKGELTGPVEVEGGWMVFKVQKVTPLPAQDLKAATAAIRQDLRSAEQAKATSKFITDLRDRWKARTRCTSKVTSPEFCTRS
jgi:parvulin-like peptidyl-prolyl isomerase